MFFKYARKAISGLCKRVKNIGSWLSQQSEKFGKTYLGNWRNILGLFPNFERTTPDKLKVIQVLDKP